MKLEFKRKVTICKLKVKKEDWFVMQSFYVFYSEQQFRWSKKLAFFPVRRLSCREQNNWRYRSNCNGTEIFQSMWRRELTFINWAACGTAQFIKWVPFFFWQGYCWQVVEGVHRPALLIFTLFQSNIYKVNVREYPLRIFVVKTDNFELHDGLTWSSYPC